MSVDPEAAGTEAVDPDLALDPETTPGVEEGGAEGDLGDAMRGIGTPD